MFDPGSSKKSMTWTRKSLAFMTSLPSFQRNWKWEKLLKSHLVKPTWKIASPINQKMVSICFNYSIQGSASCPPSLSRARNCLALSHLPAFHPNPPHCSCGGWGSPCGHLWSGRPGSGLSTRGCQQRKVCNYLLVSRCFVYWVEAERGLIILTFAILWIFISNFRWPPKRYFSKLPPRPMMRKPKKIADAERKDDWTATGWWGASLAVAAI